jgi:hypothetical protein
MLLPRCYQSCRRSEAEAAVRVRDAQGKTDTISAGWPVGEWHQILAIGAREAFAERKRTAIGLVMRHELNGREHSIDKERRRLYLCLCCPDGGIGRRTSFRY